MKLVINEFGVGISKKENRFVIKTKDKVDEYSADNIEQIIIASPSSITESVVKLAMEKNIDIVFTSFSGKPFARIYPCTLGGTTLTRREQAKAYFDNRSVQIIKKILKAKVNNQLYLIKQLSKTRDGLFSEEIKLLENHLQKFSTLDGRNIDEIRETLLGYEGYSASIHFSCLNKIVSFTKRDPYYP